MSKQLGLTPWSLMAGVVFAVFVWPAAGALAAPSPGGEASARVIVKFRDRAGDVSPAQTKAAPALQARARQLGERRGLALTLHRSVSANTQVVLARGMASADLARRLAADADVEYAVVDRRMRRQRVPSDPLFAAGGAAGPAVGQWYLKAPAGEVRSAIDAVGAWDLSTGSANVVVAVLDTGVRFDHPDLLRRAAGGKLLPGYDFVRNSIGNDGDAADADASDPGDWVTQAEIDAGTFGAAQCTVEDSSWHGTQVAALVGALSNNGSGMTGTDWNARILPLRVLGKCGGYSSDIIAGMRWAVGLPVPNAPLNPHPARVLNLSLGGDGACDPAYQAAVNEVIAAGAVVVASAGNSAGHSVGSPANCTGVIAVGGLRHIGSKVGFSDLGPEVSLSAPGGNCVNLSGACLYPIVTAANNGRTVPADSIYTDGRNITVGTSFAAPLVAGTAALMLAVHPNATPAQVRSLLQSSAAAFPSTGAAAGTPACRAPQFDSSGAPVDQLECYCTAGTCGAGMLDARAAVQVARTQALAATGVQALITVGSPQPMAGEAFTLDAAGSLLAAGNTLVGTTWSLVDGAGIVASLAATTPQVSVTATGAGTLRVALAVVDSAGNRSSQTLAIAVAAPAIAVVAAAPAADSGGGGGAMGWGYLLALLLAACVAARPPVRAASRH